MLDDEAEEERGVRVIMAISLSWYQILCFDALRPIAADSGEEERERVCKGVGRLVDIEEG